MVILYEGWPPTDGNELSLHFMRVENKLALRTRVESYITLYAYMYLLVCVGVYINIYIGV